jgi:hypothetical protein
MELDIHTKPEQALQALIDDVADPELKQALTVVAKKLGCVSHDRNRADWGVDGTTDADDSMCITIGVVVW